MPRSSQFPICSLCNESVEIETAKTDERGDAVHEECYVLEIRPERTRYIAISPMTLACPRCAASQDKSAEPLTANLNCSTSKELKLRQRGMSRQGPGINKACSRIRHYLKKLRKG
jgi:hypothetical protein